MTDLRWGERGRGFQRLSVNIGEFKTSVRLAIISTLHVGRRVSRFYCGVLLDDNLVIGAYADNKMSSRVKRVNAGRSVAHLNRTITK